MSAALVLRELVAGYGGVPVVHGLNLEVGEGEVVALLGANGAGKTTTLLTVSGLLAVLSGEVEVLGERRGPARRGAGTATPWRWARRGLAQVPEDRSLFFDLTVAENLRLGRSKGPRTRVADTARALALFPALGSLLDRKAGLLSGGEQQMLALARALVARPRLLMVDEMSLGLAPIVVERLLPVVRSIAEETGAGVLLVEQHVPMALRVADRAYVVRRGHVVASGDASGLARRPEVLEASYLGDAVDRPDGQGTAP